MNRTKKNKKRCEPWLIGYGGDACLRSYIALEKTKNK